MCIRRRNLLGAGAGVLWCAAADAVPLPFIRQIAPDVFGHFGNVAVTTPKNRGDIANLGVIVGDDAVAVVDTGGSAEVGRELLKAIRSLTNKPIRYIINTHEHPDHIFGNVAFATTGATFVGHHNLPRSLGARGAYYLQSYRDQLGAAAIAEVRIIPPTILVADRMTLDLGKRPLRLAAWGPAHSDCDLTVLDEASGTLFSGDLDFLQHVPVIDGSLRGWLDVLDKLPDIAAKRVLPGHGRLTAPWPRALDDERRYLQRLKSDAERLIADGASLTEASAQIGQSERRSWALFDAYNGRNATVAFTELEWE